MSTVVSIGWFRQLFLVCGEILNKISRINNSYQAVGINKQLTGYSASTVVVSCFYIIQL